MPTLNQLRGLKASDRPLEEQKAINNVMGYKDKPDTTPIIASHAAMPIQEEEPKVDTKSAAAINAALRYQQHLDEQYEEALAEREQFYGTQRAGSVNSTANDYLDKIANNASSYYKRFKGTDKLPLDDNEKKKLAAAYDARKQIYGEQNADVWLDSYMKDKVGQNQSWWEQAVNSISHLIPAIEGGAIQTYGMLHGAINHIIGSEGYDENPDLNWWDSFINDVIDNPVTRYGRDVEMAGASNVVQGFTNLLGISDETASQRIAQMKNSATEYNPEGIGEDAIVTTAEQDESYLNATTPWQALQSGGFTALSMLTGAGEAKAASWIFGRLATGANWLNKTGKIIKTEKGLERTLEGLKKVQNVTDIAIIPGAVGSVEGAMEGLNTKIDVEREAVDKLDEYYKDIVSKEAETLFNDEKLNPMVKVGDGQYRRKMSPEEAFKITWNKYQKEYNEARRQIDWASSKAGIHNFWANSLINGMLNTTLKAGLMAPRVQETLRNSKILGWAYRNPKFNIDEAGNVTSKMSKLGTIKQLLKEPIGEGLEEYLQSLSSDTFSSAAENNIDEFVKNKFEGDGTAKIADSFSSDYAAALTALKGSLSNKESIESGLLGAISSTMGTVGGIGRGYHRDAKGNLVQNSLLDYRNLTRGLDSKGNQESRTDYLRRITPWRSGLINAYFDRRKEVADANETAATMTEWIKDPQNKAKWGGLVGTANWMSQMENAAESNDQFSYRKAQMGKAINDTFMLSKLKGTNYYESMMQDLQRAASGEITAEDIQKLRQNGGEEYQNVNDQEIVEKVQSNANKMLGLMSTVEREERNVDRLLGRVDEDTKQSLVFGKIMEQDFKERRDRLQEEIDRISGTIQNSTHRSNINIDDGLKKLILTHGSINKALKAQSAIQEQKEKLEKKIEELEKIDSDKTSDKQKEELAKSKIQLKEVNAQRKEFDPLYTKDEKGRRTNEIDTGLYNLVLNEQEIMQLDSRTRAMVLAQGAAKLYNATHQNRQRVDQLNLELDDINRQIDLLKAQQQQWTKPDGGIKKGHNKQYQRNTSKISELQKQKENKMRQLDAEQGKQNSKPIYNSEQQQVIDNLIQQGMAQDSDFLDKVVDMGRLDKGIKDYHTQYQAILSDPRAYYNYVQRAKYNAQKDLTRRRAERIAGIQDYKEYAQELDRLTANASQQEMNEIMLSLKAADTEQKRRYQQDNMTVDPNTGDMVLDEAPKTNLDRYLDNIHQQRDMMMQFAKNPNLTDNDQSLLQNAMQYLSSNGIDVTDRDNAVQALLEEDEQGNVGGKFREFVESKNDMMPEQQRAFMPVFTSIGQVVSQYVDLLNGVQEDAVNRENVAPTIVIDNPTPQQPTVVPSPSPFAPPPAQPATPQESEPTPVGPTLFNIGGATPDAGHFVDDNGTVATGSQTQAMQERQAQSENVEKHALQQLFEQVTTSEIAQMVDAISSIIETNNISEEAKTIAKQYLEQIAVNSNERLETIDDMLTAIQEQVNALKNMANQQEKDDNPYKDAAGVLQKMYGSLNAKKMRRRGRTLPMPSSRPENTRAAWIHTANIAWMEKNNPDAWAVQFTNDHAIDEWNRDHIIDAKTPVFFLTDSDWTAEVTRQMTPSAEVQSINPNHRKYDTLSDMPVIAAVRVETPTNPATTTAVEVGGLWYQPIGVMPGAKARNSGAERTVNIRQLASKEQGRHLITENGLPNGKPLTTRVYGANYLTAHHPDAASDTHRNNTSENNTDIQKVILETLPKESWIRLNAMSKEDMLKDPEYLEARNKFLNGLGWGTNPRYPDNLAYTPDNRRQGETGNPMLVLTVPLEKTKDRTGNKTLPEVLENGTGEDIRTFNSRTQRLYDEIIRPLFQYIPYSPIGNSGDKNDKSAKIITQEDLADNPNAYQEEADRLTHMLNGFDGTKETKGLKGISDFIYVKSGSGWSIKVTAPTALQVAGDIQNSQSVYKVFFVNQNSDITPIELGTIRAGQRDTDAAFELLKNIMWDGQQVRDFLNWQTPKLDAQNLNNPDKEVSRRPRQNYAAITDDGILSLAGSSLVYDVDGVKLHAPIGNSGEVVYPYDTVANPNNATPAPPQNVTPQGEGAVIINNGQSIEPNSGANLGETNPPVQQREPEKLRKAKEITARIVADSKEFTLSEDETYYYVTDKTTGDQTKYLRVTTVIGADESAPQWEPSIQDIYNKLKERHSLAELEANQINSFKDIDHMSSSTGVPVAEIRRVIAELRTEHKHNKYGAWGVPSTAVGNTADMITRDFFAGELKDTYPNITKEALRAFIKDLELFKSNLESMGIHIVPNGVMAHGTITMTDSEGTQHDVKVAGTLDLFGYDDDGNFFIFDMKTTRNHSQSKLLKEKDKWSRQISMYADLLKQSYPGFNVDPRNLKIIPINVEYPTPMGSKSDNLDPNGPQYSIDDNGQLLMAFRGGTVPQSQPFVRSNIAMRGYTLAEQFSVGYTPFNISWDNLSSEDQDIADALATQTGNADTSTENTPQSATIDVPTSPRPSFLAEDALIDYDAFGTQEATPQAPPITPAGTSPVLPSWRNLTSAQKQALEDIYGIDNFEDYNELLNDPATAEGIQQDLKCRGLL